MPTEHTPGPHRLCAKAGDDICIRSPYGIVLAVLPDRPRAVADGRLYAAATTLLEACRGALRRAETPDHGWDWPREAQILRDAIAKATGDAS